MEVFFVADAAGDKTYCYAFFGGFAVVHEDLDVFEVDGVEDVCEG